MMIHRDPDKERRRHDVASVRQDFDDAGVTKQINSSHDSFAAARDKILMFEHFWKLLHFLKLKRRRTLIVFDRRKNKQGGRVLTMDLRVTGLNLPRRPAAFVGH